MDDNVAQEILEIQNCSLPSEEKSLLLSSYSTEYIVLALEINQLTTTSLSADDAEQKAESAIDPFTKDKSSVDQNVPPPESSSATTTTTTSEKEENYDGGEKMKEGCDNLVDDHGELEKIEETSSSQENQQQPKVNVAAGSEVNLNENFASNRSEKDIPPSKDDTLSETDLEETETDLEASIKSSRQYVTSSRRIFLGGQDCFKIHAIDSNSNDEYTMHKQQAACRHCSILISDQESPVWNAKCQCTSMFLMHEGCKDALSQEKKDDCPRCNQHIEFKKVEVSTITPQTSGENPPTPAVSTCKRYSWCCFTVDFSE